MIAVCTLLLISIKPVWLASFDLANILLFYFPSFVFCGLLPIISITCHHYHHPFLRLLSMQVGFISVPYLFRILTLHIHWCTPSLHHGNPSHFHCSDYQTCRFVLYKMARNLAHDVSPTFHLGSIQLWLVVT